MRKLMLLSIHHHSTSTLIVLGSLMCNLRQHNFMRKLAIDALWIFMIRKKLPKRFVG